MTHAADVRVALRAVGGKSVERRKDVITCLNFPHDSYSDIFNSIQVIKSQFNLGVKSKHACSAIHRKPLEG